MSSPGIWLVTCAQSRTPVQEMVLSTFKVDWPMSITSVQKHRHSPAQKLSCQDFNQYQTSRTPNVTSCTCFPTSFKDSLLTLILILHKKKKKTCHSILKLWLCRLCFTCKNVGEINRRVRFLETGSICFHWVTITYLRFLLCQSYSPLQHQSALWVNTPLSPSTTSDMAHSILMSSE